MFKQARAHFSKEATKASGPENYNIGMKAFHWAMGAGILYACGTAQLTHHTKDKELIGKLMWHHKSVGICMVGLIVPRLAWRLMSRKPGHLPISGPTAKIEHIAGSAAHWGLYGGMLGMSFSGTLIGYYSGYGFPFIFTKLPIGRSVEEKRGDIAGFAYKCHKWGGVGLEYLIGLHVAAVLYNQALGRPVISRIAGAGITPLIVLPYMAMAGGIAYSVSVADHPDLPDFTKMPKL
jgi:cytochrome b561